MIEVASKLPEPVVEPHDDSHLRSCVEHYIYTDGAREQRAEPLCSAAIRFLSLGSRSSPPGDLFNYISSTRRPLRPEVLALATKGQLYTMANATVLKTKLSFNWIGPFKILTVGPTPASAIPDGRPLHDKLL